MTGKLEAAREALELLQNKFKAKDGQQIEQLPQLPIRETVDEIGEVVSEKGGTS